MSRRAIVKDPKLRPTSTTYHIVDENGNDVRGGKPSAQIALSAAINIVQKDGVDGDEATLYVERRTLFGTPITIYRVVRQEDTGVLIYTDSRED